MHTRRQTRRGLSGLDLAFTLCGIALLIATLIVTVAFTIPITCESLASSSWPSTTGKIVERRIKTSTSSQGGKGSSTQIIIKYLYTVDGVELLGDRSAIGWGSFWKINSSNPSHQLGSTTDVHYNPEAPWKSTLRTGLEFNLAFFFSLVMVVLGLLFTFLPIHAARKKKERLAKTGDASEPGRKLMGVMLMAFGGIGVTFGLMLALVMTIVLKDDVGQANQARTWIPVEGKVITSGFVQMEEQGENIWSGRIEYQYELNDRIYTSSRYALGVGRDLKPNGKAVYGYRPGDLATVHVNPMTPEDVVFTLTPFEESWGMFSIFMLVPACMLCCGLLFALTGLFTFLRG